jgi:hypothetical protein
MNMQNVTHYLILEKAGELFIFGYEQGKETGMLEELIRQAKDRRSGLDWFDVGVLELKLREAAQRSQQARAERQKPSLPDRFRLPNNGPLWFMRDQFGPDGNRS